MITQNNQKEQGSLHSQVMLIGFCFAFVVEGASGFGTPAALAAPMLYSMGHPKLESVATQLCAHLK